MLWNEFNNHRDKLGMQYENAWKNPQAMERYEQLRRNAMSYADTVMHESPPVIKAKVFDYILENADLYINPDDWFGFALEAQKMDPVYDVGCPYKKIMLDLREKWKKEINLPRYNSKYMREATHDHLLYVMYPDYDHSTPGWEDLLTLGFKGIMQRAKKYENAIRDSGVMSAEQEAFYQGIEITYRAILKLLDRFAAALESMPGRNERVLHMISALKSLRENPPQNIYEALLMGWLYWYLQENVEAIRARTMGGIDQLYWGFFSNDIDKGIFTKAQIKELMVYFMNAFYAIRVHYQQPMYLGGMDEEGDCIINELSYLCLDAYNELSAPNPKLQAKISRNTPDAFLRKVLNTIREGNSSISIINDEVAAASLIRLGVPVEEARTSLMSGCWDYTVKDHETKTIPVRIALPKVVELTLNNGICMMTGTKLGIETGDISTFSTFDDFYDAFWRQLCFLLEDSMTTVNEFECYLRQISPANMYSATMKDSVSTGRDGYAYGMKYNNTVYTISCPATAIDSLMAVKRFVFDRRRISFPDLVMALKKNWEGYESIRTEIVKDSAKYGNGDEETDQLMVNLVDSISRRINGRPNSRGGYWKVGLLSIDKNVRFGRRIAASPDGRKAGEPLSKNLSPCIGMDRNGITTLINSVSKIDMTQFTHAGMLDILLHPTAVAGREGLDAFCGVVRTYFAKGGHSVQFNVVSAETLKRAQTNPEKYRNLQIRVCGWNVYFVNLERVMQDDFIRQAEFQECVW